MKIKKAMVFLVVVGLFSLVALGGCDNGIENGEVDFFTLTLEIEGTPESEGKVAGETSPDKGIHEIAKDTFVDLEAWRKSFAWDFIKWIGDVQNENEAETTIYMNTDKTVTAVYDEVRNRNVYTNTFIKDNEGNMDDGDLAWTGITLEHEYFYKTSSNAFGKMIVHDISWDDNDGWELSFITFKANGRVKSTQDNVRVGINQYLDLDTGEVMKEDNGYADFSFVYSGFPGDEIFAAWLRPENGAIFYECQIFYFTP